MSSSMSIDERFEALMKNFEYISARNDAVLSKLEEKEAQNEYLRKQLDSVSKQKQKKIASPTSSSHGDEKRSSNLVSSSSEEEPLRRTRRIHKQPFNSNDFRIEIPEFEGKLDPDEFLEWLHTVERIFEYQEIQDDKKVKLVALRLRKYASLWWTNLCAKRVRERKAKIRTWAKMKSKLKSRFLPPTYTQDSYSQLHNLIQGTMNVEEYTREFEKLLIKCDMQEPEEQTIVRYLGGLNPKYANVVELQQYSTFDEVCILAHKVEQQRKIKPPKPEYSTPLAVDHSFNKESPLSLPPPTAPIPPTPQKNQAPQNSLPPQPKPKPLPKSIPRCFKCQGFGHLASDCINRRYVTLAEWEAVKEVEKEEENEEELEEASKETQEEITIHADEGDMLELPSKGSKHLSLFLAPIESAQTNQFGESPNPSPNNTLTVSLSPHLFFLNLKPLTPRFCHKDKWKEPMLVS